MTDQSPDLRRAVVALLDRAADGDVADPPVAELLHRGAKARARRRFTAGAAVAAVAAATAGILIATLVLPAGSGGRPGRLGQPPAPAPTATTLPGGPTAAQWAHGSWHSIATAPINTCSAADAAWGGGYLMVVAQNCEQIGVTTGATAALYDPRHDAWTELPAPPLIWPVQVAWTGRAWVAVSLSGAPRADTGQVHAATWDIRPGRRTVVTDTGWRALPPVDDVPPQFPGAAVAAVGGDVLVAGLGPDGDHVYRLRGQSWQSLAPLPHAAKHTLPAVAVGALNGTLYTLVTDEVVHTSSDGYLTSTSARSRLLRLAGRRWTETPRTDGLPALANRVEQFGDRLLVVGSGCPPFARCPAFSGARMDLVGQDGRTTALADNPLSLGATDAVAAGRAVVAYDASTRFSGAGGVRPGDTAVWDPDTGRWQRGPSSVAVRNVAATASTPYGVIVLGRPANGAPGGVILRPAGR